MTIVVRSDWQKILYVELMFLYGNSFTYTKLKIKQYLASVGTPLLIGNT